MKPTPKLKPGKPFAIFDLDGCLFDDAWRLDRIDWKNRDFKFYHDSMVGDNRLTSIGGTLLSIIVGMGIPVVFFTAGPESHLEKNRNRLRNLAGLYPDDYVLYCRKDAEEGVPSADLKEQMWSELMKAYGVGVGDCLIAVDDHWGVVERYAQIGLLSFVCSDKQFIWSGSAAFNGIQSGYAAGLFRSACAPIQGLDVLLPGVLAEGSKLELVLGQLLQRLTCIHGKELLESHVFSRVIHKPRNHGNRSDNRDPVATPTDVGPAIKVDLAVSDHPELVARLKEASGSSLSAGYNPMFIPAEEWAGNQDGIAVGPGVGDESVQATVSSRRVPKQNAGDILAEAAETFKERNAMYKDNAFIHSKIMAAMFPNGVTLKTEEDYHMWHLFELIIVKLSRFANSGLKHQDSIRDLAVYAAMCETLVGCHDIFDTKA